MNSSWKQVPVTLSRGLRLFDVTMIGIGAMIGAGIFGLTGIAAGKAGPVGLLVAFALNGVVTLMTGLSYAELGSAIPAAGGGYRFVREGMSRFWGFSAGWISWFSNSVACSLYAVIFGAFFIELLRVFGIKFAQQILFLNLSGVQLAEKVVTVAVVLLFIAINVRGASETGTVGNFITSFKIIVLVVLVIAGLVMMFGTDTNWIENFMNPPPADGSYLGGPFPNGIGGVFLAMGLTFVAFEGYEIIAQSGEELIKPRRNLPRAIFYSIGITVTIYLLVAFVSIGALTQDSGLPNWLYLGNEGDKAMIRTAEAILPYGIGGFIMILGGLASTTSALNATIYSSSRVSFAMGRGNDLPHIFGRIHPRNRTPDIAIYTSGGLIILFAVLLPIQDVASGASLTFLILFLLVNISLIQLRKNRPKLGRAFRVPLVPWLPILAIIVQAMLALALFNLSWVAWASVLSWFLVGSLVYQNVRKRREVALEADTILLEETIAKRPFSILLPVALPAQARQLARIAAAIAYQNDGEIFALHVVRVPRQLGLGDGRAFLKQSRPLLEEVITVGQEYDVPVRTQLRLGRNISASIMAAAHERNVELVLLGWPGTTDSAGSAYGNIIDLISTRPPTDLAVVRLVRIGMPTKILVPVIRNRNSKLALALALSQAGYAAENCETEAKIVALHLVPAEMNGRATENRRHKLIDELSLDTTAIELRIMASQNVVKDILTISEDFDEIVIGAPEERLLEQQLFGSVPQKIAEDAQVNVIMVKRHDPIKHGLIGRWFGGVPVKKSYGQD
jgi:amino acid transporter/nucleotide-binding universal stress UspA family protein